VSKYSFCEGVHAGPQSPWHIRPLTKTGQKFGGGIDTLTLCGRIAPFGKPATDGHLGSGGWDLEVEIDDHHLDHTCKECARIYRKYRKAEGETG